MIYAHLAPNMREADFWAENFVNEQKNSINNIRKTSIIKVKLKDGDEHHFMNLDTYLKWSIGRTYKLDGILYHSGFPQMERSEDVKSTNSTGSAE